MKLGLCLSGGGARGAYQIGACMALKEAGILDKVEAFSGTSIGSVNAALIASNSLEQVKELWLNIPEESLHKTESVFRKIFNERTKILVNGIYELEVLERILRENINISNLRSKQVYVTLSEVGDENSGFTDLIKSTYRHYFKHDNRAVYAEINKHDTEHIYSEIIASCSIPIVFKPTYIDGIQFFDGGLYDNVPVKPLIDAGCDTIIVIHLDRLPYHYKSHYKDITFHPIKSRHSLGWWLKFENEASILRYNLGYEECKKYIEDNQII